MAEQNYPQIPSAVWWKLRDAFKRTIPSKVTDTYLSSVLNVQEGAARQYLRDLKITGLVNDEGDPNEIVYDWRDDDKYQIAAEKLFTKIYPNELVSIAPKPNPERKNVVRWFMKVGRMGEGAAGNKAAFYILLASGELQKAVPASKSSPKAPAAKTSAKSSTSAAKASPAPTQKTESKSLIEPKIQLNVQVHIGADATNEQIDAIFSSMAKHLRQ